MVNLLVNFNQAQKRPALSEKHNLAFLETNFELHPGRINGSKNWADLSDSLLKRGFILRFHDAVFLHVEYIVSPVATRADLCGLKTE